MTNRNQSMSDKDALAAQAQLQAEADALVHLLDLEACLSTLGRPVRVGSSAMGLMVRRDMDLTVICDRLDSDTLRRFFDMGSQLMGVTEHVRAVRFRNDTGAWNSEPADYPDGLYLWLSVRAADGNDWTIDIWLVDEPERQPDLAHLKTLLPRLRPEDRLAILRIKQALDAVTPGIAKTPSAWVYEAVMDHGVETFAEFEIWKAARLAQR